MVHSFEDIPLIESARSLGRRPHPDSATADTYVPLAAPREGAFRSFNLGLGLELARVLHERVFPSAAQLGDLQLAAAGPSYDTYFDCGGYNYDGTCDEACFGFAPHHMDPYYCATCAEQQADPANNPAWNWHFVGSRGAIQYIDREPDVCNGKDAWKWKVGRCGSCQTNAVFRCHDGWKKYPNAGSWEPTICQGLVSCDNQLRPC